MKTDNKNKKGNSDIISGVFTQGKDKNNYIKVNEESGKRAAEPTPDRELPQSAVKSRDLFPESETGKGKKYPTMGV